MQGSTNDRTHAELMLEQIEWYARESFVHRQVLMETAAELVTPSRLKFVHDPQTLAAKLDWTIAAFYSEASPWRPENPDQVRRLGTLQLVLENGFLHLLEDAVERTMQLEHLIRAKDFRSSELRSEIDLLRNFDEDYVDDTRIMLQRAEGRLEGEETDRALQFSTSSLEARRLADELQLWLVEAERARDKAITWCEFHREDLQLLGKTEELLASWEERLGTRILTAEGETDVSPDAAAQVGRGCVATYFARRFVMEPELVNFYATRVTTLGIVPEPAPADRGVGL